MSDKTDTTYDIVVFGATSFVGQTSHGLPA